MHLYVALVQFFRCGTRGIVPFVRFSPFLTEKTAPASTYKSMAQQNIFMIG